MVSDIDSEIMRLLPDAGKSTAFIRTPELYARLQKAMLDAPSIKTVLRHLQDLEGRGLAESQRAGTSSTWRRMPGANGLSKVSALMTFDEALALQALKRFSSRQLPELVAASLSSMFERAEARLATTNNEQERKYARWSSKVAVEGGGFALQCPAIDRALFADVSRALFEERKLDIVYRARSGGGKPRRKTVLPLGLVEVGALVYLIAAPDPGSPGKHKQRDRTPPASHGYQPAMYRMDRFAKVEITLDTFRYPDAGEFSLDAYVKTQRSFDFHVGDDVHLELRFTHGAGDHLLEARLSKDQTAEPQGDALIVRGTVPESQRLRWWLRSFGPYVEVLGPAALRAELAAEAREIARLYG